MYHFIFLIDDLICQFKIVYININFYKKYFLLFSFKFKHFNILGAVYLQGNILTIIIHHYH